MQADLLRALGLGLTLLVAPTSSSETAPTIEIGALPPYGSAGFLTGVAGGVDLSTHRVAAYIHLEGLGWYSKPTAAAPTVTGAFSVDVVTGGVDDREHVTFGFFTWDPYGDGAATNPSRELDIEDGRWGDPEDPTNAQFVVQPFGTPGNRVRYALPDLSNDPRLTRTLRWMPGRAEFTALEGHHPATGFPASVLIHQLLYLEDPGASHLVPDPGVAAFRFNLWLNDAVPHAPARGQEVEVVVTDFGFEPVAVPTLGRSAMVLLAAGLVLASIGVVRRAQRPRFQLSR
jgi:hypothetical protein